ncbi:MAG: hypothetical protein KDN22_32650 [Verrucomicrobiae bacterium]|nr:hypothetical protein [Verrucomicrobiae bacterium]
MDDISMAVFAALTRKAGALVKRDSFAGWLTLATRLQTAEALRREDSRRRLMRNGHGQVSSISAWDIDRKLFPHAQPNLGFITQRPIERLNRFVALRNLHIDLHTP